MPQTTTNYGFKKPLSNEYVKPDDFNDNWDKLDGKLKDIDDRAPDATTLAGIVPITSGGTGSTTASGASTGIAIVEGAPFMFGTI